MEVASVIRDKLALLPDAPGVYLMKNFRGEIVYIGKAVNLKSRVRGYFAGSAADGHLASHVLRSAAKDMEWIVTENEVEALILEANLVKKHAPRYNVELKDDKHYPYIRVTVSEPFPRLLVTRHAEKGRDLHFGPFTNAKAMRKTIQLLNRVFRIRDCDLKLPVDEPMRPCLSHHIGRCDAPCAHFVGEGPYRALVEEAVLLLRGKRRELRGSLETSMRKAAAGQRFEEAARIRDQLRDLDTVLERQRVDFGAEAEPMDLIAARRAGKVGSLVVLEVRDGFLADRKQFEVGVPLEQDESAIITDFLKAYYLDRSQGEIPREILLSHAPLEEEHMEDLLRTLRGGPVTVEIPQRGEKHKQMRLALANADMQLTEFVARRERRNRQNHAVTALQEDLGLPAAPNRIEGFDISHLGGTDTVASQVVFVDGAARKQEYRHYQVKSVQGIDDFASMREIVSRRLRRLKEEGKPLPDLILIDGGKGQLHAAYEALKEHGCEDQAILGLAKRLEEVFMPGQNEPILLPRASAALRLLQQVRDEAHRFAITFQRSKRKARLTESWLDSVPGVGEKTKLKLLRAFKSPEGIREASPEALASAAGKALARKIAEYLAQGS